MKQSQLSTSLSELIKKILGVLSKEHYLSKEQVEYKFEKKAKGVEITLDEKLYDIIARQPPEATGNIISLKKDEAEGCVLTLKAGGHERYVFAEILEAVLMRLNYEKNQRILANRQKLDDAMDEAIENSCVREVVCPKKTNYKLQRYTAIVYVGNEKVSCIKNEIDEMIKEIKEEFPKRIKKEFKKIKHR